MIVDNDSIIGILGMRWQMHMSHQSNHIVHPLLIGMLPLKVVVVDDDFGSLKWSSKLLMRDPRTTVIFEASSPTELIPYLKRQKKVDAILLDIEYQPAQNSLEQIISSILTHSSKTVILCLSNHIEHVSANNSIPSGIQAYMLKAELGMGIATAVTLACQRWFVLTPGIWRVVKDKDVFHKQPTILLNWEPHPQLTPSLQEGFELRVMYRMRAPMAAIEIQKSTQTIEKYVNLSYMRLEERCSDDLGLEVINWQNLSPEERAFILYTQPETTELPLAS